MLQSKCVRSWKHTFLRGIGFLPWICRNLEFRIEKFNFLSLFIFIFFSRLKFSCLMVLVNNLKKKDLNYPKGSAIRKCVDPTESQNGRGWQGPLWVTQSNPPAQARSPRAGCTAPRPGGSGISPEKETPPPPWAAWARAPSPSEGRSSSSCSDGASSASVCAHCPLSCRWAPLNRVWPHPPDPHPAVSPM